MPPGFKLPPWIALMLGCVRGWMERSRQRRQLHQLSDEALEDIGLTRDDVRQEVAKPFWLP